MSCPVTGAYREPKCSHLLCQVLKGMFLFMGKFEAGHEGHKRGLSIGTTGRFVALNVAYYRKAQGMTLQDLSDALAFFGRPTSASALSRIENQARAVDVDELMALSVVIGVRPSDLMRPRSDDHFAPVGITGYEDLPVLDYDLWVSGKLKGLGFDARLEYWTNERDTAQSLLDAFWDRPSESDLPEVAGRYAERLSLAKTRVFEIEATMGPNRPSSKTD